MNPKVALAALAIRTQATREVLALIANSDSDREAGRKALLLAFVIDKTLIGTQRELARKLGVTEGRASQMLKAFRERFAKGIPSECHRKNALPVDSR